MEVQKKEAVKSLLKFGIGLGQALENALKDGKFDASDIVYFKDTLFNSPMVFYALPLLKGGLGEMSKEDKLELEEFFVQEFNLENDKMEEIIEDCLKIASLIFGLVGKVKA